MYELVRCCACNRGTCDNGGSHESDVESTIVATIASMLLEFHCISIKCLAFVVVDVVATNTAAAVFNCNFVSSIVWWEINSKIYFSFKNPTLLFSFIN